MSLKFRERIYTIKEWIVFILIQESHLTATEILQHLQHKQTCKEISNDVPITELMLDVCLEELTAGERIISDKHGRYYVLPQLH